MPQLLLHWCHSWLVRAQQAIRRLLLTAQEQLSWALATWSPGIGYFASEWYEVVTTYFEHVVVVGPDSSNISADTIDVIESHVVPALILRSDLANQPKANHRSASPASSSASFTVPTS